MVEKETMKRVEELFEHCSPFFLGLGDEQRQKLILDIAENAEEGINVTSLAAKSKLSRPAISHHLKVLKDCGIIVPIKKGTQIFYRLKILDGMKKIRALLDELDNIVAQLGITEDNECPEN